MRFRLGGVLNGHLSSVWISIEQSVMVSGIGYAFYPVCLTRRFPERVIRRFFACASLLHRESMGGTTL